VNRKYPYEVFILITAASFRPSLLFSFSPIGSDLFRNVLRQDQWQFVRDYPLPEVWLSLIIAKMKPLLRLCPHFCDFDVCSPCGSTGDLKLRSPGVWKAPFWFENGFNITVLFPHSRDFQLAVWRKLKSSNYPIDIETQYSGFNQYQTQHSIRIPTRISTPFGNLAKVPRTTIPIRSISGTVHMEF